MNEQPYRFIPLSRGMRAIVDAEDFENLNRFRWCVLVIPEGKRRRFYAGRYDGKRFCFMHRKLLPGAKEVDHRNLNGLDNRKSNLRPASRSLNMANGRIQRNNTSGYKGVTRLKKNRKWMAQSECNRNHVYLGSYKTREAAACAYDLFALKNFGEFARTNILMPVGSK
jgi:hypothetical protein